MFRFLLILIFVSISNGFLLENTVNSLGQTGGNQQYITKSELYDIQMQLQNGIDYLRHDTDRKLVFLTSQIQQMLASLKPQITENNSLNDTKKTEDLERKYSELMANYTRLRDKLESLQIKYTKQETELQIVNNKTIEHSNEILNLNSLKNMNNITDIRSLQQEVQSVSVQTHSLAVNENVRNQELLALYNLTVTSNSMIQNSFKEMNMSLFAVRQQIDNDSERVAVTACAEQTESGEKQSGEIIKYGDIRTQVNVRFVSSLKSSGKFICEKEGLYLLSAWDSSNVPSSSFSIYKNGNLIASAFVTSANSYITATAVVAVELRPADTVWVQVRDHLMVYYNRESCLTIVKIK